MVGKPRDIQQAILAPTLTLVKELCIQIDTPHRSLNTSKGCSLYKYRKPQSIGPCLEKDAVAKRSYRMLSTVSARDRTDGVILLGNPDKTDQKKRNIGKNFNGPFIVVVTFQSREQDME